MPDQHSTPVECANPECDLAARNRDGTTGRFPEYCSPVCRARVKAAKERDRVRVKMAEYRAEFPWCRLRRYGLTMEEAEQAWQRRGFGCAICGSTRRISFDHCHKTGMARDWLCNGCNAGIGYLGDDPERLRAAATYLDGHRKTHGRRGNG